MPESSPPWGQIGIAIATLHGVLISCLSLGSYFHTTPPFPGTSVDPPVRHHHHHHGTTFDSTAHQGQVHTEKPPAFLPAVFNQPITTPPTKSEHSCFRPSNYPLSPSPAAPRQDPFSPSRKTKNKTKNAHFREKEKQKQNKTQLPNGRTLPQSLNQGPYSSPNLNACQSIQLTAGVGQSDLRL